MKKQHDTMRLKSGVLTLIWNNEPGTKKNLQTTFSGALIKKSHFDWNFKSVSKDLIDNESSLILVMTWRWMGVHPIQRSVTSYCVTGPQKIKDAYNSDDTYIVGNLPVFLFDSLSCVVNNSHGIINQPPFLIELWQNRYPMIYVHACVHESVGACVCVYKRVYLMFWCRGLWFHVPVHARLCKHYA